ncbi:MAG: Ku protein, partial [Oceanidesulfovibrio sp.]
PYYLAPTGAKKPYALLADVLEGADKAGIAEFVMNARQNLAAVISIEGALCLVVLRYPAELRSAEGVAPEAKPRQADVKAMRQAIDALAGDFDAGALVDAYQQRLDSLIEAKKKRGETVKAGKSSRKKIVRKSRAKEKDILEALEKSLEQQKRKVKS